jgi:predicted tellurium resistance membrane protein TerC
VQANDQSAYATGKRGVQGMGRTIMQDGHEKPVWRTLDTVVFCLMMCPIVFGIVGPKLLNMGFGTALPILKPTYVALLTIFGSVIFVFMQSARKHRR